MSDIPFVSVILPVRNEEKYIDNCIQSIMNENYPKEKIEILIIDGMSDDATGEKVLSWSKRHKNILLFDNPKKIVTSALNIGIKNARGNIIVRLDAHAEYAPDYITKCVEWLEKTGAANVGGAQRAVSQKSSCIAEALSFANNSFFGLGGAKFRDPKYEGYVESVWPGAFRKEVLDEVGGFTEALYRSEDIDINSRIRSAGYKIFMSPEIKCFYHSRETLSGMIKRCFLDGRGIIQTLFLNRKALSLRHFIPFIFVSSILLGGIFSVLSLYGKFFLLFLGGIYLLTNVSFSIKISIDKGFKYALILPIIFTTIHFSYGIGSLWGIIAIKCWLKNKSFCS